MQRQDRRAAGKFPTPPLPGVESLARKRDAALEGVRSRIKNVGVPPKVRSKRDRSANQENR